MEILDGNIRISKIILSRNLAVYGKYFGEVKKCNNNIAYYSQKILREIAF
jgi:hypothetical protein